MDSKTKVDLQNKATQVRITALNMVNRAQSGHIGGSFSVADILTVLYHKVMNVDPKRPKWEGRDRLVMSKGHCTPALYAVLAQVGFFPEEDLKDFRETTSYLSGHAEMNVPGVDMSTGSLGQGLSAAVGMALAGKLDRADYFVYSIHGDGELQEGMIWEAAMTAAKYQLDNLIAIIDDNKLQLDGTVEEIMPSMYPVEDKFEAFGWHVITCDGHDLDALYSALQEAREVKGKPIVIIAQTVKGKGVSFMENNVSWHGNVPSAEEYEKALAELEAQLQEVE